MLEVALAVPASMLLAYLTDQVVWYHTCLLMKPTTDKDVDEIHRTARRPLFKARSAAASAAAIAFALVLATSGDTHVASWALWFLCFVAFLVLSTKSSIQAFRRATEVG
jgi:Ca2+/Na+ antiporter